MTKQADPDADFRGLRGDLFGFDADVGLRNIVGVLERYPDIGRQGVMLRKFGHEEHPVLKPAVSLG